MKRLNNLEMLVAEMNNTLYKLRGELNELKRQQEEGGQVLAEMSEEIEAIKAGDLERAIRLERRKQ